MVVITNNGGHLVISGLPQTQKEAIKKSLQLPNPAHAQMLRMKNFRALRYTKPFIYYFSENKVTGDLTIGRGCEKGVLEYLQNAPIEFKYVDSKLKTPISVNCTLRDYQVPVIEEFKLKSRDNGQIVLSTGWGKTLFAIKLIELYQCPTLIIVPRGHLLAQFQEDISTFCGYNSGTIQGQNIDIKDITVATIETVKKHTKLIRDKFTMVIVDEAHLSVTPQIIKTIQSLCPKYLYGMSGSPMRSDQQHHALKWIFGKPIVEDYMKHEIPTIQVYNSNVLIPVRDYPSIVEEQVLNNDRNSLIAKISKELIDSGRTILLLTKRVAHTQTLEQLLGGCGIIPIYASKPQKIKAELLDKLRSGSMDYNGLLGTAALLGTGTDLSKIDSVIIGCDIKSRALLIQCIGRALRLLEGKPNPLIVDIHDNQNIVLHRQYLERLKYYKEKGWTVIEMNERQKSLWQI